MAVVPLVGGPISTDPYSKLCKGAFDTCAVGHVEGSSSSEMRRKDLNPTKCKGLESDMSSMKEAVCFMGVPEDAVQLAISIQELDHGSPFTKVTDLFETAYDIFNNPEKRERWEKRLVALKEKAKPPHKGDLPCGVEDSPAEVPAPVVAEKVQAEAQAVSVDKVQLQRKVKKLAKENHRLKERKLCRVCKKVELANSGVTFLPCGHFITCEACSDLYDDCPACGRSIMGTVRTFLS